MHLKNPFLFGLMAILLLGGTITPVLGQSSSELNSVLINEVELNPAGSDAGLGTSGTGISSKSIDGVSGSQEYVELYNPTSQEIDISGWSLTPSATWKAYVIPSNTIIEPKSFLAFTNVNYWFKDFGDTVSLYHNDGTLLDETPLLVDKNDDSSSWQRVTDGLDNNSINDWELKRMTPKSSNGKIIETDIDEFLFTGEIDKTNYTFGEYITISGTISEIITSGKPLFVPEFIKISISGPNYYKNIAIYPDRNLEYLTTLNIQEVYGFKEGDYNVKISYGESIIENIFSIYAESESDSSENSAETMKIFTDKESYIPGETVTLFGDTNSSIEYGGLDYTVTDPNGKQVFAGTIFQNSEFSIVNQKGGGQIYPFSAQLFMSNVNPIFGIYEIEGVFKHQNSFSSNMYTELYGKTSFILSEDVKEDVAISLTAEKDVYSAGDIIKISGRSNNVWTEDLALEIEQTSIYQRTTTTFSDRLEAKFSPFTLKDSLRLEGDGRFSYEFQIIENFSADNDNSYAYGDYRIKVSEYFGDASIIIKVVEDPESFIDIRTPLGLKIDKSEYVLGTAMKITGNVMDYEHKISNNMRNNVEVTIVDETGKKLSYQDRTTATNDYGKSPNAPLLLTAIPDSVGNFQLSVILHPIQFNYGVYTLFATHSYSNTVESVQFEIKSAQADILTPVDEGPPLTLNLEKDVYYVGEKLEINGKVIPISAITKEQSSSGNTATAMETHTNYSQAIMNYVEVSIPYPKYMSIVKSSNYKTTPNENENYTGGGGSGGGGTTQGGEDGKGTSMKDAVDSSRHTGYDGKVELQKQKLLLTDMNFKAYPDENGNFSGMFDLRAGIFSSGTYLIKANYYGHYTEATVTVIDNSLKGGISPEIIFNFDKSEYVPGETVRISGKIANAYYYDSVSIVVGTPAVSQINCLTGQQCGFGNTEQKLRVQESVEGPKFFMNYKIPSGLSSIGTYNVVVDTHFGQSEKQFFVISESDSIQESSPESKSSISKKIIEKFNRISIQEIPIVLTEKTTEDSTLVPRVLQGSLFTSARGEESDVNLRISTTDGQCVIGQNTNCLVSESTRKPGAIYSIVTIDDINYKIRYSGNDVRLEKFSIVPEESNSQINIDNWNVEIIKDEQPSRFYYKVSYVALE